MSQFSEHWKKNNYRKSDGARLAEIDFQMCEIDAQMQAVVDPTRWRFLLDDKAKLEEEKKGILARSGEFKMA